MRDLEQPKPETPDEWRLSANCATTDPDIFFPERGNDYRIKLARKVCLACDVQQECLEDALQDPPEYGYRAGYSPKELRALAKTSQTDLIDERAQQAQAMRDDGATLQQIAKKLGYASHGGVRFLLDRADRGESA